MPTMDTMNKPGGAEMGRTNAKPVRTVEALAIRFPNGKTIGYDVEGGYQNLLTGRVTACVADEGRTTLFAVNTDRKEAAFSDLPAGRSVGTLPSEEPVEEILEGIVFVVIAGRRTHAAATVRILHRGFSIDVHDRRFNLLGHLRERVRQLLWLRYGQRGSVRGVHLPLTGVHTIGNHGSNQDPQRQDDQHQQDRCQPVRLQSVPKSACARVHTFPSSP